MKELMTGNEAIARGVYESGITFAAAYPGTPSTEILETLAERYRDDLDSEWSTNEKVAVEAAIGYSFVGGRSFSAMAAAGDIAILEAEEIVEVGEIDPGDVRLPGPFIDHIVHCPREVL